MEDKKGKIKIRTGKQQLATQWTWLKHMQVKTAKYQVLNVMRNKFATTEQKRLAAVAVKAIENLYNSMSNRPHILEVMDELGKWEE